MGRFYYYIFLLLGPILALSCANCTDIKHEAKSSTTEAVEEWLKTPIAAREALAKQWFYNKPLSIQEANSIIEYIGIDYAALIANQLQEDWKNKIIKFQNYKMKFDYKTYGKRPLNGRSLFISLHGGGGTTQNINDQQWKNQINLYQLEEGIYLAPRATTDTWDLWHLPQIDPMLDKIIQSCILFEDVNPDRVYIMGYSAGGDGTYQLASRMADRWAAAAMMAGHPGDASPLNLRNIGFTQWVGEYDNAYQRNKMMLKYGQQLDQLQEKDPTGYIHNYQLAKGKGHWMDLEDKVALPWIAQFRRKPFPETIAWHQDNVKHRRFYWISVAKENSEEGDEIIVRRKENTIIIERCTPKTLTFWLNDSMMDLDLPVKIIKDGVILFNKKINRTTKAIQESMEMRFDFSIMFSASITLDLE